MEEKIGVFRKKRKKKSAEQLKSVKEGRTIKLIVQEYRKEIS